MSATLKPCPFCNASGDELLAFCDPEEGHDNSGPSRRIQCAGCHVEAPFYPTEAEAIAAWNRRAGDTSKLERKLAARDRRISRLVGAIDYARSQGFRFPADDEPKLVCSESEAS